MGRRLLLDEIADMLRSNALAYQRRGVVHLFIFGSVARGEAGEASDVDLLLDIDPEARFSLLDLIALERETEESLGCKVDLVPRRSLKPGFALGAENAVAVF
jgi:predicted nucleotidyltransferase